MMLRLLVGVFTAFVISSVAFAQRSTIPAMPKQSQDMAAAMAAAQAKAVRPGDEALGCAAIEKELMTSMNDPAVQSYAAKAAAAAQLPPGTLGRGAATPQAAAAMAAALSSNAAIARSMASMGTTMTPQQIQAMQALAVQQAQALSTPQAQAALQAQALAAQQALASPQVQAALQAQAQALATPQAQAALAAQSAQLAQLQDPSAQLAMMTTVMPQMMRSQRLVGLALAKGCTSVGAMPVAPPARR
jgi:hypothetical protein